jgi:hypothetical protein
MLSVCESFTIRQAQFLVFVLVLFFFVDVSRVPLSCSDPGGGCGKVVCRCHFYGLDMFCFLKSFVLVLLFLFFCFCSFVLRLIRRSSGVFTVRNHMTDTGDGTGSGKGEGDR